MVSFSRRTLLHAVSKYCVLKSARVEDERVAEVALLPFPIYMLPSVNHDWWVVCYVSGLAPLFLEVGIF